MSDYIARMIVELDKLHDRLENLEDFLETGDYEELAPEDRRLLDEQHELMMEYRCLLSRRLARSFGNS